jgi:citrate lyase gamma subunit
MKIVFELELPEFSPAYVKSFGYGEVENPHIGAEMIVGHSLPWTQAPPRDETVTMAYTSNAECAFDEAVAQLISGVKARGLGPHVVKAQDKEVLDMILAVALKARMKEGL